MARKFKFRLGKTDRERYPGGEDEWYPYDEDQLLDEPASILAGYETLLAGNTIGAMVNGLDRGSANALRVMAWVARRRAGVRENFDAFDPRVWHIEYDMSPEDGDDRDPPGDAVPDHTEPSVT